MMTYRFKVSLPGIKGFSREYLVNGKNSLYHFHKQMLSDMEFPLDQVVLFKGFDAQGNVVARYATIDLGDGSIDRISIAHIIAAGIVEFTYFYDTTNKKSVIVSLSGEEEGTQVSKPELVFEKGPIPQEFLNGYVAYEDLPPEKRRLPEDGEDDEDDDEEESEEEEDGDEEEYGIEEENLQED